MQYSWIGNGVMILALVETPIVLCSTFVNACSGMSCNMQGMKAELGGAA